jgi:hypothetical protein
VAAPWLQLFSKPATPAEYFIRYVEYVPFDKVKNAELTVKRGARFITTESVKQIANDMKVNFTYPGTIPFLGEFYYMVIDVTLSTIDEPTTPATIRNTILEFVPEGMEILRQAAVFAEGSIRETITFTSNLLVRIVSRETQSFVFTVMMPYVEEAYEWIAEIHGLNIRYFPAGVDAYSLISGDGTPQSSATWRLEELL